MIFISNSSNINVGNQLHFPASKPLPEESELTIHIGRCLNMLPSKQLGRCLRDAFLLRLEELQKNCPDFGEFVAEFTVLLMRLDNEEDKLK